MAIAPFSSWLIMKKILIFEKKDLIFLLYAITYMIIFGYDLELKMALSEETDVGTEADAESEEDDEYMDEKLQGFAGMGDVISKILEKPITSNDNVILCKSKKSQKRKLEIKKEFSEKKAKEEKLAENREMNHVIPTHGKAPQEVLLRRIATKGVVKLLNAVAANQKLVSDKMKEEKTEAGKCKAADKIKQSDFMDLLKKKPTKSKKTLPKTEPEDIDEKSQKKWDVLRDDFMIGSSFKDWDKVNSDEEKESQNQDDNDSSSDEE